jgi:hypothetical protein
MGWGNILGSVLGMAGDWFQGQRERQHARLTADIAIETARATADIDWDIIQAQNSKHSLKDELWHIVLAAPLVAIFFPSLQPHIIVGFESLELVPEWYIAGVALAIASAFGYREFVRPFMERMHGRNR